MRFTLFEKMGLGNLDVSLILLILTILVVALIVLVVLLLIKENKLTKTYRKFMTGKNVKSLEKEIVNLFEDNVSMKEEIKENRQDIRQLFKQMKTVYQRCAIVRYDAFKEMGGSLSFCLTLLDEENSGFILNSVHSSGGCYNYIKEITGGRCAVDLGAEEQQSLDEALEKGIDR